MSDVTRALEQIAEIHGQLAKGEVYRGWRSVTAAASGVIGIGAAWYQATWPTPIEPVAFAAFWLAIGVAAIAAGCSEIVVHYGWRATATERRRTRQVFGQFLPALVAGAVLTLAVVRVNPALVPLLPGIWALFFGVGIFSARPYLPRSSGFVAAFYCTAGAVLLWTCREGGALSPWTVGGTFGAGQWLGAAVLYWNLERGGNGFTTPGKD